MKNKKELQKYFRNKYYNKNNNYEVILSEIKKEESIKKNSFFKIVAAIIISLFGTTGIVFASNKIYNEYIKKQNEINSNQLFVVKEGTFSNVFSNDMIYADKVDLYYKIITNIEDYDIYKTKINELPEMTQDSFNDNFLIIIGNWGSRQPYESDLTISDVNADETTTCIKLKQKEKPNYNKTTITLYAIIDKALLREKTNITIEYPKIETNNFASLDSLPDNYSVENALNDGCFVEENYNILSNDKYAIDELIKKSQNGEEDFLRIYSKYDDYIRIIDLEFKDGIFFMNERNSINKKINSISFKYLTKRYFPEREAYEYGYNSIDSSIDVNQLLIVKLDWFIISI